MREDVSRRKALSLLGAASALTLSGALGPSEAGAETTGTAGMKSHRARRTSRHQRPTVQPASAPAEAAPPEFKPTNSASAGRPPLHSGGD